MEDLVGAPASSPVRGYVEDRPESATNGSVSIQPVASTQGGQDLNTISWPGWAELENDPVRHPHDIDTRRPTDQMEIVFSTLLHEWEVQNVEVQEVTTLDTISDSTLLVLRRLSMMPSNKQFEHDLWVHSIVSLRDATHPRE